MLSKSTILGGVGVFLMALANSQADTTFVYAQDFGQGLNFSSGGFSGGSPGSSFSIASPGQSVLNEWSTAGYPQNSSAQFMLTGSADPNGQGDSYGLSCWFTSGAKDGAAWTYNPSSGSATVSPTPVVTFYVGNGSGAFFSGTVDSVNLNTVGGNVAVTINIDGLSNLKTLNISQNSDLSELLASTPTSLDFTLILGASSLRGLNGNVQIDSATLSAGAVVSPVPEPTTVLAGAAALGLLVLGVGVRSKWNNIRIGK